MRKITLRLVIIFIITIIISCSALIFAYNKISQNYIYRQTASSLVYMLDKVSVDVNIKVNRDYDTFDEYLTKHIKYELDGAFRETDVIDEDKTLAQLYQSLDEVYLPNGIKFGYIEKEKLQFTDDYYAKWIFFDGAKQEIKDDARNISFYNRMFTIASFSDFVVGAPTDRFVFFKRDNFFAYFDAKKYLSPMVYDVDGIPENQMFLVSNDGIILYREGDNIDYKKNKLFSDFLSNGNFEKEIGNVIQDMRNGEKGFYSLEFEDTASAVCISPLDENFSNENLYLVYIFNNDVIYKSMSYLMKTLVIVLVFILCVVVVGFGFVTVILYIKERDIEVSKLVYFISKPFLIITNRKGKIKYINNSCKVKIKNAKKLKEITDINLFNSDDNILSLMHKLSGFTVSFERKDDEIIYVRFIPMRSFTGYYLFGEDITKQTLENMNNRQAALFNGVTNLPNKRVLLDDVNLDIDNEKLSETVKAMVSIDITDFSRVNRIFGYIAADNMLRKGAKIITDSIKEYDAKVYNIRTSLFVIYFKNVTSFNEVIEYTKKNIELFSSPISLTEDTIITVDVRMGVYSTQNAKENEITADKMYTYAEKALERAKVSELEKYAVYNAQFGEVLTRNQVMEHDLRKGIDGGEFKMYFQPQFNTEINRIVGFEALVRWDNSKYRLSTAEEYITLAEKNGMIVQLGRFIMRETFGFAKTLEPYDIHISMNVSPVQLLQAGFVSELIQTFNEFKLKNGSIALEITETFLMENSNVVIDKLRLLRENGFSIHLDDFGIGYSSMLYLKDLPIDTIKIDKEFTKHILNDKFSRAIVITIIKLALSLNLNIIAEGVEYDKQAQLLLKNGCEVIQGYLIGKALPISDAIDIINKYNSDNKDKKTKKNKGDE